MTNYRQRDIIIFSLIALFFAMAMFNSQASAQTEESDPTPFDDLLEQLETNQTPTPPNPGTGGDYESDTTNTWNEEIADDGTGSTTEEDATAAADEANKKAREALVAEREEDNTPDRNDLGDCAPEFDVKNKNSGGRFVPVKEIDGMLMQFARDTNQQTGEIKMFSQQMCMHLRALKRVAYKFEVAEFLEKPQLRTVAGQAVNEYKKQLFNFVNTGRKSDFNPNSPQFVDDLTSHQAEGVAEATVRVLDAVSKTNSPFKTQISDALGKRLSYNLNDDLECPVTAEEIRKANDSNSDMPNSRKLDVLLYVQTQPGCTVRGAYKLTTERLTNEIEKEQSNRAFEYEASGGYKSVRECVEKNSAGLCLKWKNTVPVSALRDVVNGALNSNLQRYLNPQPGDIDTENANGPQLPEFLNLTPSYSGNIAMPTGNEGDLNSGLKPSTGGGDGEGGGTGGGNDGGGAGQIGDNFNIVDFLEQYLGFSLPGDPAIPNEETLRNLNIPPLIFTYYRTPTEAELNADQFATNHIRLAWMSLNAKECKVGNNWLAGTFEGDSVETVYQAGENIDVANTDILETPLTFYTYLTREREVVTDNNILLPDETATDIDNFVLPTQVHKQLYQTTVVDINVFDVKTNDIFTLHIKTPSGFEDVYLQIYGEPTRANVISQFQTAIVGAGSDELDNFKFTYDPSAGKIYIVTEPKYVIVCENDKGVSTRTINVERR
ncbi:MAG: hypothetical protein QG665_402 [Patescibacteria group bacterium]|nr:hypothetical protein [Patescibacteria group bacterium]